jgi:hypothetical protein
MLLRVLLDAWEEGIHFLSNFWNEKRRLRSRQEEKER